MIYVPTEWKDGDVVTADKLNHLEQGIAGLVGVDGDPFFVIHCVRAYQEDPVWDYVETFDKTFADVKTAIENDYFPVLAYEDKEEDISQYQVYYLSKIVLNSGEPIGFYFLMPYEAKYLSSGYTVSESGWEIYPDVG